ncbi:MAG: hypothetical protein KBG84_12185 [Planctomycetes bacterium]|nr:hypothetical protein [Planctomycetota bacterium]
MLRTLRISAALALFALPLLSPRAQAQLKAAGGDELVAGKSWPAGTLIKSDAIGVSFKVPQDCTASVDENTWLVALRFEGSVIGAASVLTGMSAGDAETFLGQPANFSFLGSPISVEPSGKPATEGRRTSVEFSGQDASGTGRVLRGESDNALAVVIAASAPDADKVKTALDEIEKSATFLKPQDDARKAWQTKLAGRKLTISDEANSATLVFDFTQGGDYAMTYSVGEQSQQQSGKWHVELGVLGGLLVLNADGTTRQLRMKQNGADLIVEGYPAKLSGGNLRKPGDPAPGLRKGGDFKSDIKEVASLDGKDMNYEVQYDGGTQLKIPLLGMSLKIPQGCIGGVTASVNYVLIRPQDQRGLGTIAMQTGVSGIDDIAATMAGAKDLSSLEEGLVIEPEGEPKVQGGKATLRYTSANYVCYAIGLVGPSLNAAMISFIGPKDDDARIKAYAESIANSMQFAKPDDAANRKQWNEGLKGYCLHYFNYRAAKDNSWDSTTNIHIHFGSDSTFLYTYQHEGTMGVRENPAPGNPITSRGVSGNNETAQGTWRLEFTITGALVYLTTEKGDVFPLLISVGKQIFVNGSEVSRVKSDKKQ